MGRSLGSKLSLCGVKMHLLARSFVIVGRRLPRLMVIDAAVTSAEVLPGLCVEVQNETVALVVLWKRQPVAKHPVEQRLALVVKRPHVLSAKRRMLWHVVDLLKVQPARVYQLMKLRPGCMPAGRIAVRGAPSPQLDKVPCRCVVLVISHENMATVRVKVLWGEVQSAAETRQKRCNHDDPHAVRDRPRKRCSSGVLVHTPAKSYLAADAHI
mmetsp:Transcript_6755/g.20469  ORF Transcript_6755/g.20469 Transcript_6755/m.20469 type:complete len:212 (-) Transcript_6755:447-1082(-)